MAQKDEHLTRCITNADQIPGDDLKKFFLWWDSLKSNGRLPHPKAIDLLDMTDHMDGVTLLDVVDGGRDFRIRFLGQDYTESTPVRRPGDLLSQSPPSAYRNRIATAMKVVIEARMAMTMGPVASAREGLEYRDIFVLLLPWSEDGVHVSRVLSILKAGQENV